MEKLISHLVVLQFKPFQRGRVVCRLFAAVGMQEGSGWTTTGGEKGVMASWRCFFGDSAKSVMAVAAGMDPMGFLLIATR
jgi:hypothetical protein